jgi:hypothetical protein
MHYLTELADKLVTAYQDRDNLLQWVSHNQTTANRQELIETLRSVLEKEVADGCLRYNCVRRHSIPPKENVFSELM